MYIQNLIRLAGIRFGVSILTWHEGHGACADNVPETASKISSSDKKQVVFIFLNTLWNCEFFKDFMPIKL
ncbi:MAG TPA: hypothetical protein PLJ08_14300, partial [Cyclobacteriaceae bacterium]|nr:hypothetical protein [Cyclobacteriaceae bacterium]